MAEIDYRALTKRASEAMHDAEEEAVARLHTFAQLKGETVDPAYEAAFRAGFMDGLASYPTVRQRASSRSEGYTTATKGEKE